VEKIRKKEGAGEGGTEEEERREKGQEAAAEEEAKEQKQGAKKEKEKREVRLDDERETIAPVLVIDQHRPDRIIFEGKEIRVTSKEFSLTYIITQHPEQVLSYDEILDQLWKDEEDAIYNRVSYHFSKVRSAILKIIGKSKKNKEKVKNIFKVVSRRGIMLNLEEGKLKIN